MNSMSVDVTEARNEYFWGFRVSMCWLVCSGFCSAARAKAVLEF